MNFVVKLDTVINFYPTYCVTVVIPHTYNQRSLTRVFVLYANINGQKVFWTNRQGCFGSETRDVDSVRRCLAVVEALEISCGAHKSPPLITC